MTFDSENPGDPLRDGFHGLESLSEDHLGPGAGFTFHAHKDIEQVTYVRDGALTDRGADRGSSRLRAGEFKRSDMHQGFHNGIFNESIVDCAPVFNSALTSGPIPAGAGVENKHFHVSERRGILRIIASPNGRKGSLHMRQDIQIYSSLLNPGTHLIHELRAGRFAWLHVVIGRIALADHFLAAGDGASFVGEAAVSLTAQEASEILLFDLV